MQSNHQPGSRWADIAVVFILTGLFGFLAYKWAQNELAADATRPKPPPTPMQAASGVIRQITSCLIDPAVPVGKPLKHIGGGDLRDQTSAYFYASPTQIYPINASGQYLHRVLYCQASVK